MGTVAIKIKIMPKSLETNLEGIEKDVKSLLEKNNAQKIQFESQPVAFGLKALIVLFGWPEEKEFEEVENRIRQISGVSSLEILDMRRAIG